MPVRIYDIAKQLGLENKEVLVKAKELGITAAKVPSSSLDKITAEYLEQQLAPLAPPPAPMAPVQESVVELISSPPPPPPVPVPEPAVQSPEVYEEAPPEPEPVPVAPVPAPPQPVPAPIAASTTPARPIAALASAVGE